MEVLDLDDDLNTLRVLGSPTPSTSNELEAELDNRWREKYDIPETGYRVVRGIGLDDMAVWRVAFLAKARMAHRERESRCWVQYKHLECIWHGSRADTKGTHTRRDGTVVEVFLGKIESFQLTMAEVIAALKQARDAHRREAVSNRASIEKSIRQLQEEVLTLTDKIAQIEAFDPEAVLPCR